MHRINTAVEILLFGSSPGLVFPGQNYQTSCNQGQKAFISPLTA